ncbi:pentapeptide repeat-containing protein [Salinifilum aidingensis]
MERSGQSKVNPPVLSTRTIAISAAVVALGTLAAATALFLVYPPAKSSEALDIIRTAAGLGAGTGGIAGLVLTARRQQSTEIANQDSRHDARETRVTDLYFRAAEQLDSDRALVRSAGIFALERLAQEHPSHRQTVVDLLCLYLRTPPERAADAAAETPVRAQEWEVRQTVQEVLIAHLSDPGGESGGNSPGEPDRFWPDIRVDLNGAQLHRFLFTHCRVRSAVFTGARFTGPAVFRGSVFDGQADFREAAFDGLADFRRVRFTGQDETFRGARFAGEVDFGTHTAANLTGAATSTGQETRRKWPVGWLEGSPDVAGWSVLTRAAASEATVPGAVG